MPFDALKYLRDHRIPLWTEGKNVSPGWVNIRCPLCPDASNHGGFSPDGYYSCWRCGGHDLEDVIMALERIPFHEACSRVREHQGGPRVIKVLGKRVAGKPPGWPEGAGPLLDQHKQYLKRRKFNPDFLEQKYSLRGTTWFGDYRYRVIAPIIYQGVMVSYQGRDWTDKAELRYKACQISEEMVHHKHILYNLDNCQGDSCLVVEGITDVWNLGDNTCATFGSKFTKEQVVLLAERFSRVFLLFDSEPEAQTLAKKLRDALASLGLEAINLTLASGDPGEMKPEMVDKLKKEIGLQQ